MSFFYFSQNFLNDYHCVIILLFIELCSLLPFRAQIIPLISQRASENIIVHYFLDFQAIKILHRAIFIQNDTSLSYSSLRKYAERGMHTLHILYVIFLISCTRTYAYTCMNLSGLYCGRQSFQEKDDLRPRVPAIDQLSFFRK